ncbi:hypothetical protein [Paenarthrobacter sp. 2TAF44]|uniref:hypothetical protein n=1 Tax=Paenarthrobacter sp. 2TAF44 TaxID=3233018 RepID=UPI003F960C0E
MKTVKDPLFITIVSTGITVGAGAVVSGGKYPVVSFGLLAAWLVVAVVAGVILARRRRHG